MAINLSQAFNRTAPAPIDGSLVLSKADMLAVNDNLMPEKYFTICTDDGQIYTYDKNATPNAQTGKFSPYSGGGTGIPIGAIIGMSGGTTVPDGFLKANGQIVNIADYPYLAQYYEDNFGAANHFGGDGTTTFAVEDVQGEFLRGTGANSHANQGGGAAVGTHQDATESPVIRLYSSAAGKGRLIIEAVNNTASGIFNNQDTNQDKTFSHSPRYFLNATSDVNLSTGDYSDKYKYAARPTNTSVLWVVCASKPVNTTTEYEGGTGIEINGNVISTDLNGYILKSILTSYNFPATTFKQLVDNGRTYLTNMISAIPDDEVWEVIGAYLPTVGNLSIICPKVFINTSTPFGLDFSRFWVDSATDTSSWMLRIGDNIASNNRCYKVRLHTSSNTTIENYSSNTTTTFTDNFYLIIRKYKKVK